MSGELSEVVTRMLTSPEPVCTALEVEWQVGASRFADVADALRTYAGPSDVPHPSTEQWRARGLDLGGPSIADQVAGYLALRATAPGPFLLIGEGLSRAAAQLSTAAEPHTQIIDASRTLTVPGDWHRHMFLSESTGA